MSFCVLLSTFSATIQKLISEVLVELSLGRHTGNWDGNGDKLVLIHLRVALPCAGRCVLAWRGQCEPVYMLTELLFHDRVTLQIDDVIVQVSVYDEC